MMMHDAKIMINFHGKNRDKKAFINKTVKIN